MTAQIRIKFMGEILESIRKQQGSTFQSEIWNGVLKSVSNNAPAHQQLFRDLETKT